MGVDGAHNTVGKMSAPTTLLGFYHARKVIGYYPVGVQGTVLGTMVDLSALPYFLRSFPGPYRADIPSRLVLASSDCASRRRAVSKVSTYPGRRRGVRVRNGAFGQAFQSERPSGGGLETKASAPVGEVGQSQKAGVVPPRPDLLVGDWIALLAYRSDT